MYFTNCCIFGPCAYESIGAFMNYRKLGSSDLEISEIGFGTWPLGGPVKFQGHSVGWRGISDAEAIKMLKTCPDMGINFIDTADIYGNGRAESLIGKAYSEMGKTGQEMIIATKGGFVLDRDLPIGQNQDFSEKHLRQACEASLKRLKREAIDLFQMHCIPLKVIEKGDCFLALDQLKKEGKIREYGVSIVMDKEAIAALEYPGVRSIQIIFNLFRQKPVQTVFPKAKEKGVGILARVPLASGLLGGKYTHNQEFPDGDHRSEGIPGETFSGVNFKKGLEAVEELRSLEKKGERSFAQAALSYTIQFPEVATTIPGGLKIEHLKENAKVSGLPLFTSEEMSLCQRVYEKFFKDKMEKSY